MLRREKLSSPHLEILGLHVNLHQGISNEMPKTTSIEITVLLTTVLRVINLGELQTPKVFKTLGVEILMRAPDLEEVCITGASV